MSNCINSNSPNFFLKVENLQKIRSAELKSFFQGFKSFSEFWVINDAQYRPSVPFEAILGDETMISYVLWNKNMMQARAYFGKKFIVFDFLRNPAPNPARNWLEISYKLVTKSGTKSGTKWLRNPAQKKTKIEIKSWMFVRWW